MNFGHILIALTIALAIAGLYAPLNDMARALTTMSMVCVAK